MARYIDADKLKTTIKNKYDNAGSQGEYYAYDDCLSHIDDQPTADVEEVKHGYWIGKPISGYARIRCSVCRTSFVQETGTWKRCPDCGAKMDGGKE